MQKKSILHISYWVVSCAFHLKLMESSMIPPYFIQNKDLKRRKSNFPKTNKGITLQNIR